LIRKRGFIKKESKRLPITDNNLIEGLLGQYGIICLEDVIAALNRCDKADSHFDKVRDILWPI
jgi:large subunit ribosomal protein L7e